MILAIDAGHGGSNRGTSLRIPGMTLDEADWTLDFAQRLRKRFTIDPSIATHMIRTSDISMPPKARGEKSAKLKADLAVIIHVNAQEVGEDWHGLECYVYPGNERTSALARDILFFAPYQLQCQHGYYETSVEDWRRNAHVLVSAHKCDAILIECGYATHPDDRAYLYSLAGREKICDTLESVIRRYALCQTSKSV